MNEIIHKGRFDPDRIWAIIIGTVAIATIMILLLDSAFSGKYYNLGLLVFAIGFFILFGYFLVKSIRNYKAITIYENSLQIRWLFGLITTTINKESITQFGRSAIKKSDHIYIKTHKYDLLLEEKITENNELIIEQLRSWHIKRKDNIQLDKFAGVAQKAGDIFLMIFSVLLLALLFFYLNSPPSITDETSFTTISGYLQRTPEIINTKGRNSTKDVIFYLGNYPAFKFSAGRTGYYLMNHDHLSEFRYGDSITLLITRDGYEKKIARSKEADYFEKHSNWPTIAVYAVEIEKKQLLSLQAYKERLEEDKSMHPVTFIILITLYVGLFIWGLKEFRK